MRLRKRRKKTKKTLLLNGIASESFFSGFSSCLPAKNTQGEELKAARHEPVGDAIVSRLLAATGLLHVLQSPSVHGSSKKKSYNKREKKRTPLLVRCLPCLDQR